MTRQDKNEEFLLTSFLYGGNAAYIDDLYAKFKADPASVDATWASFFGKLEDSSADASANATGPSWQRRDWPQIADGELVSALDGNWDVSEKRLGDKLKAKAEAKGTEISAEELQRALHDFGMRQPGAVDAPV